MSIIEILQIALPLLLYLAGVILLVMLIILCVKLLKTMNKIDNIVDDVDKKVKSLNGVFSVIDFFTDKISSVTDIIVNKITKFVIGFGKRKYNKKEEDEYE